MQSSEYTISQKRHCCTLHIASLYASQHMEIALVAGGALVVRYVDLD